MMMCVFCVILMFTEAVVAESVVVIKKLLQMNPTEHKEIIRHMAKLADAITVSSLYPSPDIN